MIKKYSTIKLYKEKLTASYSKEDLENVFLKITGRRIHKKDAGSL